MIPWVRLVCEVVGESDTRALFNELYPDGGGSPTEASQRDAIALLNLWGGLLAERHDGPPQPWQPLDVTGLVHVKMMDGYVLGWRLSPERYAVLYERQDRIR